jgi:hypothetical protein
VEQLAMMPRAAASIARIATSIATTAAHIAASATAAVLVKEALVVMATAGIHEIAAPEIPNARRGIVAGARTIDIPTIVAIYGHRRGLVGRRSLGLRECS